MLTFEPQHFADTKPGVEHDDHHHPCTVFAREHQQTFDICVAQRGDSRAFRSKQFQLQRLRDKSFLIQPTGEAVETADDDVASASRAPLLPHLHNERRKNRFRWKFTVRLSINSKTLAVTANGFRAPVADEAPMFEELVDGAVKNHVGHDWLLLWCCPGTGNQT
jgi:hypothetical protein